MHTNQGQENSIETAAAELLRAGDRSTSPADLDQLSCSESDAVRAAVAVHPGTDIQTLTNLTSDTSDFVRGRALMTLSRRRGFDGIHPTAIIHPGAQIGRNVAIGPYTIVYDNAQIGHDTVIESNCEIGHPAFNPTHAGPLKIGEGSLIRSHSIFYEGSEFGPGLVTGHRVTVREKTMAGPGFQIGTLSDIQGHCTIGKHVRFHSNVHIGQHSRIGNYVWIFPYVVLTNDPHPPSEVMMGVTIEDYVAIATMSIVLPGVKVGAGALIGAHSSVAKDVEPDTVVAGAPAKLICETAKIKLKDGSGLSAYPWRRHFHRGYPPETVARWLEEFASGKSGA
ncbi:MAG: N-acetyltransferase [Rubrivivax sp.]